MSTKQLLLEVKAMSPLKPPPPPPPRHDAGKKYDKHLTLIKTGQWKKGNGKPAKYSKQN